MVLHDVMGGSTSTAMRQGKLAEFLDALTVSAVKYPRRRRNACRDITALCEKYAELRKSDPLDTSAGKEADDHAEFENLDGDMDGVDVPSCRGEVSSDGSSPPPESDTNSSLVLSEDEDN